MRRTVLQAVIEVPMSKRQALNAARALPSLYRQHGIDKTTLTGHSILRGLSFVELILEISDDANLLETARVALTGFTIAAESAARGSESEEFAVAFAEVFWEGFEHQPEAVLLDEIADRLGIGGTDEKVDLEWATLLAQYYNPVVRELGEVQIKRSKVK